MNIKDVLIILIGLIAGAINTVAGGGSALTLPALILFAGLPPSLANGTNRLGIFIQTIFAAFGFKSKGVSPFALGKKHSIAIGIMFLLGATLGARLAIDIADKLFSQILSVVMCLIVALTLFKPKATQKFTQHNKLSAIFQFLVFFFIGLYAGIIQAGTGLLIILSLSIFSELNLVKSNALKTILVFMASIGTITMFAYHNKINFHYAILLGSGNAIGGWLMSRWSVGKADKYIKFFMIGSVMIMAVKLWLF